MSFGPMEMLGVALGAAFRDQIWNITVWPLKTVWRLLRGTGRSQGKSSAIAPEANTQVVDVTPVVRRIE